MIEIATSLKWLNSNQRLHRMQAAGMTKQWRLAGHYRINFRTLC